MINIIWIEQIKNKIKEIKSAYRSVDKTWEITGIMDLWLKLLYQTATNLSMEFPGN